MLVVKDKRALLFKLKDPAKITTVIPGAKRVNMKGHQLIAVHHRPDEVQVLRNLGYEGIPDPMTMHYPFKARFAAAGAQTASANFLSLNQRAFCLNSMGMGKTITVLWTLDYMIRCGLVKRALVVCPLSTIERTWADEIFRNFPDMTCATLHGDAKKRLKLLDRPHDVYIVNHDGVKVIQKELAKRPDIDLVIVDEVAVYRNATTARWKVLNDVVNKQTPRRAWGLTGAPIPNAPTDAWAQVKLICPNNPDLPKYVSAARDATMRQVNQFTWVPKPDALDTVHKWMQPSVRFALDDTFDLPEQVFVERHVDMSPEQNKAYRDMSAKLLAEYKGGQVAAVNAGVKANKLVQIACGVAYQDDGSVVTFPSPARTQLLRELIEESEGKVIVFVPLTGVLDHLETELKTDFEVARIDGSTPKTDRDRIFSHFQDTDWPRVLIANPGTMSHGLTLTKATTIIWFAPINSADTYVQANARVRRPGQTRTTVVVHIEASGIERKMYERLAGKVLIQDALLEIIKEVTAEIST